MYRQLRRLCRWPVANLQIADDNLEFPFAWLGSGSLSATQSPAVNGSWCKITDSRQSILANSKEHAENPSSLAAAHGLNSCRLMEGIDEEACQERYPDSQTGSGLYLC